MMAFVFFAALCRVCNISACVLRLIKSENEFNTNINCVRCSRLHKCHRFKGHRCGKWNKAFFMATPKAHPCTQGTPMWYTYISYTRVRHALIEKFIKCELQAKNRNTLHWALMLERRSYDDRVRELLLLASGNIRTREKNQRAFL